MNLTNQIKEASQRISPYIHFTTLEKSLALSELVEAEVYLKNEHCQKTGSFKIRGALNKVLLLTSNGEIPGIVGASAGNHGIGVAYAGKLTHTATTIFVPNQVDPLRLKRILAYGAHVIKVDGDCESAEVEARLHAQAHQLPYISPYNDLDVISGQGTIGLELIKQLPDLDVCYVSVGGGGLISGIGEALKSERSNIQLIGCSPENSSVMATSVSLGMISKDKGAPSLSDSTAGGIEENAITLPWCQKHVSAFSLVTESEIRQAMRFIAENEGWIIEGAAAVSVAALIKSKHQVKGKKIVVVLCGRNIHFETHQKAIDEKT